MLDGTSGAGEEVPLTAGDAATLFGVGASAVATSTSAAGVSAGSSAIFTSSSSSPSAGGGVPFGGSIGMVSLTEISDSTARTMMTRRTRICWRGHLRHDGRVLGAVDLHGDLFMSHVALFLIIGLNVYFDCG